MLGVHDHPVQVEDDRLDHAGYRFSTQAGAGLRHSAAVEVNIGSILQTEWGRISHHPWWGTDSSKGPQSSSLKTHNLILACTS
jgi:hypothetical protein